MSPLFGKKKQNGSLIALIDIESGSVASALAYIEPSRKPKLFAQERRSLSPMGSKSGERLWREIERELEDSFVHLNQVAARMRGALPSTEINRVAVFLHAPWVSTHVALEKVLPKAHDETLDALKAASRGFFDTTPVSFHSFATTTSPIVRGLFNEPEEAVICSIGGEVTELMLMRGSSLAAHATTPVGFSTILRTLRAHAGVSEAQARSILSLSRHTREHMWAEAVASAVRHMATHIKDAAGNIVSSERPQQIFVLSPEHSSDLFARALTEDETLHDLFSPGSTVRGVSFKHATPYFGGHPKTPDLPLMLESLFVDTRFGAER